MNAGSIAVLLAVTIFTTGCATDPADLGTPQKITCVDLKAPLSFSGYYGIVHTKWTTRLEKGPYVSEKFDGKGTYYRAPPGGLSVTGASGRPFPGMPLTMDGGFYIPISTGTPVWIYRYFSTAAAPVDPSAENTDCTTVGYLKDPVGTKLSIVRLAAGGALGGAAGGVLGRGMAKTSTLSYGQAAGVGAASGIVAGLLIGSIINSGVGKIIPALPIRDATFVEKLRDLASNAVAVPQIPRQPPAATARPTGAHP